MATQVLSETGLFPAFESTVLRANFRPITDTGLWSTGGGPTVTQYFKMRAQDSGAGYVTWRSTGTADFLGTGYAGGSPTPVGAMVVGSAIVAATWSS